MSWFYLALLATFLYAVVNLLDDNLLQFVYKSPYVSAASAGLYGALPLLSRPFISAYNIPPTEALLMVLAGYLTVAYYFFYFVGLGSDSPSVVVALFSLAPATIPFLAHFIVHEQLSGAEIIGFSIVLVASLGLALGDARRFKFSKALLPMVVAVIFMDAVALITKYVYQKVDFYPAYLYFSIGMGLAGVGCYLLRINDNSQTIAEIAKRIKRLLPVFVITELIGLSAEFTLNFAISRGPVSLVKVIEGIQPMLVLLIALVLYPAAPKFFREIKAGRLARKFFLMVVAVAGLAVISFAAKA